MYDNDPQLTLARAVGRLEGVIGELSNEIKGLRDDMKSKVDEKQSEGIAAKQVAEHEKRLHKKNSIPPGATLRIDGALIKKLLPWVIGAGGGGWAGFELISKILGG